MLRLQTALSLLLRLLTVLGKLMQLTVAACKLFVAVERVQLVMQRLSSERGKVGCAKRCGRCGGCNSRWHVL